MNDYGQMESKSLLCEVKRKTIRQQMQDRLNEAERRVQDLKSALAVLDENPGFEKVHDAISKLGF